MLHRFHPLRIIAAIGRRAERAGQKIEQKRGIHAAARCLRQTARPYKVNVGCGPVGFSGWVNMDVFPEAAVNLEWDVRWGLPFQDQSCMVVYSEHFLEHLTVEQAVHFMKECKRVLLPSGILRIGMPDLRETVREYYEDNWKGQPWLEKYGFTWIGTGAEMLNICFREWGHLWLYDYEELHRRMAEAGFLKTRECPWGFSEHPELCNRETRSETLLIVEAIA